MNKKIKKLCLELIEQNTVTGNKKETEKALIKIKEVLRKDLKNINIKICEINGFLSLIAKTKKKPKLVLCGHIDVVPGSKKMFKPKIKKAWILGRGAIDMKGPLAALIITFIKVLKQKPDLPLALMINSDEEIGGFNGAAKLAVKFKDCKVVVIPDSQINFDIVKLQKAPLHFCITKKGVSAHASQPWRGKNPLEEIIPVINRILQKRNNNKNSNTLCLTKLEAGKAFNQIPEESKAFFDVRLIEKAENSLLIKKIKKICAQNDCQLEFIDKGLLFQVSRKSEFINIWKNEAEKELKRKIKLVNECGASDARFFSQLKIPVIITSPKGTGAHSEKEKIHLPSLFTFAKILKNFILLDKTASLF